MNVLGISSEMVPYAKTGGLADVVGALPRYLRRNGHDVRVFVPLYDIVNTESLTLETVVERLEIRLGVHTYHARVLRDLHNPAAYLVQCPALYARGSIYSATGDEHRRFLTLCHVALQAAQRMRFAPDIIHCNDWQSAMMPLILRTQYSWDRLFSSARTLLTIHNLNYQGGFTSAILPDLNLRGNEHLLHQELLHQGRINFLLHGIMYADAISTVSPTYAREIQTAEHGAGLDPFLRARSGSVVGILNGVDYDDWSPETDKHIPHRFSASDMAGKELNKRELLETLGLPYVPGVPLAGIVSRMAIQKGFDLIPEAVPPILAQRNLQLIVLGNGEGRLESIFANLQRAFPKQVVFHRGFSNPLAHMIEAGADLFVMPSRYEPCGLNQMYSLRYGTIPIVHRTGGLADTVAQWSPSRRTGTGFLFDHHDPAGLRWAIEAAMATYRDKDAWKQIVAQAMGQDFSWATQARAYESLFARMRH